MKNVCFSKFREKEASQEHKSKRLKKKKRKTIDKKNLVCKNNKTDFESQIPLS